MSYFQKGDSINIMAYIRLKTGGELLNKAGLRSQTCSLLSQAWAKPSESLKNPAYSEGKAAVEVVKEMNWNGEDQEFYPSFS